MADNVTAQSATLATIPASTVIATDDSGGAHYQIVELADATTPTQRLGVDSGGRVTVKISDGTDALAINADGSINIAGTVTATSAPTADQQQTSSGLTTATTAYSIGDTVGAGWTFTGMADAAGGHGVITGMFVLDEGDVLEGLALWFASGSITFGTDNAAPSISDSDARKLVAGPVVVPVSDLGGCRAGGLSGLEIPYTCDATSLYVYATTTSANAVFAAVGDVKVTLMYRVED